MSQMNRLTAETLLGTPRRGDAVPNADGCLVLYTLSTHKFGDRTQKEVRIMNVKTGFSSQLSDDKDAHDATWIPGTNGDVIYLCSGREDRKGRTRVVVANGVDVGMEHYIIADIDAAIADLKLKYLGDGSVAFVVTGLVGKDGSLFNDENVKHKSTGRIYDTPRAIVWNELRRAERYSLWYTKLVSEHGKWKLAGDLTNLIEDTNLEIVGKYNNGDARDSYDVSKHGIAFIADDLGTQRPHEIGYSRAYYASIESFVRTPKQKPRPVSMPKGVKPGSCFNIRISPDTCIIGLLYNESGSVHNERLYMTSAFSLSAFDVLSQLGLTNEDYYPPSGFEFTACSNRLILKTSRCGRDILARLKLREGEKSIVLFKGGRVSSFRSLQDSNWDQILVSSSNFLDSSVWQVVSVKDDSEIKTISSMTNNGKEFSLSPTMVSEFWFEGADNIRVQSFMLRPSNFDESKAYPWVLMPHGGPVTAHMDAWSTRWNAAAWAEQGYVVILPNITGSSGFGCKFANRIRGEYGGRPATDILKLVEYLEKFSYLDQDKAILAGASYGAYLISWLFGDDIIKKFCGAVWHDGVYGIPSTNMQNDLIMDDGIFEGSIYPWIHHNALDKWNPARPDRIYKWKNAPPTLIIHSEKDYRCPFADGIATMHALQGHGVPTRLLTFPDEGHWVLNAENSLLWHHTVWDWTARCVAGKIKRGDTEW